MGLMLIAWRKVARLKRRRQASVIDGDRFPQQHALMSMAAHQVDIDFQVRSPNEIRISLSS
jgi:hypothetical protein